MTRDMGNLSYLTLGTTCALLSWQCSATTPSCSWEGIGQRYGIDPHLMYAIATVESGMNPNARGSMNNDKQKTYDIGLMQINSGHLPKLAKYGIDETALYNPCVNMEVGAWLIAQSFQRHGVNWNAVGAYNASCTRLVGNACEQARAKYAWKVFKANTSRIGHASRRPGNVR